MTISAPAGAERAALQADAGAPPRNDEALATGRSHKITDIEVLRGIAVLFVIVHHLRGNLIMSRNAVLDGLFHSYFQFWPGVDLFFAISGFVIARSLLPKLMACETNTAFFKSTVGFWIRRAWRLLPSAWFWLALMVLAPAVFNRSGAFGSVGANFWAAVAGVFDVANFRFAYSFAHAQYYGTSFAYWSLSLEEQFYLLLPVFVFLFRRWLAVPLVILVAVQFFTLRSLPLMIVRTDAILLGVLLAMWSRHVSYKLFEPRVLADSRLVRLAVLWLVLGCIAALGSEIFATTPIRVGLIALLSAVLVWVASYDRNYLWRDGVTKTVMIWVGARSYGLYLIHIPVYCLTREIWFRLAPHGIKIEGATLALFVLTAAFLLVSLSELNYRFIEVPLRRYGARIAERFRA